MFYIDPCQDGSHLTLAAALTRKGWKRGNAHIGPKNADVLISSNSARPSRTLVVAGDVRVGVQEIPSFIWAISEKDVEWKLISPGLCKLLSYVMNP